MEDLRAAASAVAASDDDEGDDNDLVDENGMPFETPAGTCARAHSPQTTGRPSGDTDVDWGCTSGGGDSGSGPAFCDELGVGEESGDDSGDEGDGRGEESQNFSKFPANFQKFPFP